MNKFHGNNTQRRPRAADGLLRKKKKSTTRQQQVASNTLKQRTDVMNFSVFLSGKEYHIQVPLGMEEIARLRSALAKKNIIGVIDVSNSQSVEALAIHAVRQISAALDDEESSTRARQSGLRG